MWAQSQGAQAALPGVMPPGYPFGNPAGPPMFNGGDQTGWGAYGQAPAADSSGEAPQKKAKTENGDGSSANGSEGGNNNAEI